MSDRTSFWFASIIFNCMPDDVTFVEEWARRMETMELSKSLIKANGDTDMNKTRTNLGTTSESSSQSANDIIKFDPFDFSGFN